MHDRQTEIADRVTRVLTQRLRPAVYRPVLDLDIESWDVPAADGRAGEPVPVAQALPGPDQVADYRPYRLGQPWGPPWGTTWFHLSGEIPADLADEIDGAQLEIVVELGWSHASAGFQAEALVYRPDGSVIKALNPLNTWIPVSADEGRIDLYLEAAANPVMMGDLPFAPTEMGDVLTAPPVPLYAASRADLNVFCTEVWELVQDVDVLDQLFRTLSTGDPRRADLALALDRALDAIDLSDVAGSAESARAELRGVLSSPASASAHTVTAVGHAHIDSAWLWPTRETVRKVARTVSNQLNLLESHPDLVYAMSSAQQYAWIKEQRPEVYEGLRQAVADGRFVPVGAMWVESDTNMVGAEAMARQFTFGQRFFESEFGTLCEEVWLPDSFGYSAALPQIVTLAGAKWFLTQKISWNKVNVFPHHTFAWEGIDGTRVFTHFPPIDTYNSDLSGRELAHAVTNFRDKGASSHSLAPFGWGDGGGGPTREMIARARRTADLEGSPKVVMRSPREFFAEAQAEYSEPAVWKGELYLEIHRGTYTSQAKTKQGNRRSEHLLREAELWWTTAAVRTGADYPYETLERIWRQVLLNQFHDILPGSAIAWVHRQAREEYAAVAAELEASITEAQQLLGGATSSGEGAGASGSSGEAVFNASPFDRDGVPALSAGPLGVPAEPVRIESSTNAEGEAQTLLDNGVLRVLIDHRGLITSAVHLATGREAVPPGQEANLLQLHPDFPNAWDAWDIDAFYRHTVTDLTGLDDLQADTTAGGSAEVTINRSFGTSTVRQVLRLAPGRSDVDIETSVDWHEQEKLLKLAFAVDVHADHAAYETQFGHVVRPTHENTSWDSARFEVCAHRWVHLGESGFGVALANDSTYGHDVSRHPRTGGGSYSVLRQSVIRGPRYPDPQTDQGEHTVRSRLVLGAGIGEAVRAGYEVNLPARPAPAPVSVAPLVRVDDPRAVVESVKLADDRSGDVIVRLYEAHGGRAHPRVEVHLSDGGDSDKGESDEARSAGASAPIWETDLLERPLAESTDRPTAVIRAQSAEVDGGHGVVAELELRPFQIVTLRIARQQVHR